MARWVFNRSTNVLAKKNESQRRFKVLWGKKLSWEVCPFSLRERKKERTMK